MQTQIAPQTDMRFKGFVPDFAQKEELLQEVDLIKSLVPDLSSLIAMVEFEGDAFACTFDLFLKNGSTYAFAEGSDIHAAITQSSQRLEEKLKKFRIQSLEAT